MIENQQINITYPAPSFKYLHPVQYLERIINYASNNGQLLSKFTPTYIAQTISITKLEKWSQLFPNNSCISMEQFIGLFGSMIPHQKNETIYLIISLMEIYEQLKYRYQKNNQMDSIQYGQITNYLCQKILNDNNQYKLTLKAKNQRNCNSRSSPSVTYMYELTYPYICSEGISKQKSLKNAVKQLEYSQKMKKIICLTYHSKQIQLFDLNLKLIHSLEPTSFKKLKKQWIIISFAYSQLNQRIGCVIYNGGLLFWEAADRFETQKFIENVKADSIFYLKYNDEWGTIKNNTISIWNIHSQHEKHNLTISECNQICSLQQINQTPNIVLSIILKNKVRQLHLYSIKDKIRLLSKIQIDSLGCHKIYYNVSTQTILQIGYNKNIKVWHSDTLTFELIALGYLQGHRANVTAVTTIGLSSIIATSDEKGYVKLWDLRQLRCYQTFRLSFKQIYQLINVNECIIFGDSRINIKSLDYKKEQKSSTRYIRSFYDENNKKNYIFNSISCSIANENTGEIQYIFEIFDGDEELTCIEKQKNFFVMGTNKGNIILIDKSFKRRKSIKIHETNIMKICINSKLKSLITVSNDQSLILSMLDCDNESVVSKKTLIDLPINQIQNLVFQVSNADYLIGISLNNSQIMLIDMESLKIFESKVFSHKVITFKFHLFYQLFVVCLQNNKIYVIEYCKKKLEFKITSCIELTLFQIFNFTQDISTKESITMMTISKKGDLICVWDHKFIEIYDLESILIDLKRQKKQQQSILQAYVLKNTCENYQEIQQFSQSMPKRKQLKRIWCKNINKNYNIQKIDQNDEAGIINLICNKNILLTLDSKTFQVQCERKQNETYPKIWNKLSVNKQKLKNKLIKAIKICQKIYQMSFKQEITQFINYQQLDPCNFLSTLTKSIIKSDNKQNINNYRRQYKIKQNRHQSLFESKNMSLKIMETQKRLNKIHQLEKKRNQDIIPMNRKMLEQLKNKNQNAQDPFFRVKIDQRFSIGPNNQGDTCQLYDRILKKYQKSKQKKVYRSISGFGISKFNITKYKTFKNMEEPTIKRKKPSNKNILKSKIENMYLSKDKRTQIIRRILKRQYAQ